MYNIQTKSDMLTGTSLTVQIPEHELDKKALYTIQATKPEFVLPMQTRYIDGQIEFVYQVSSMCKLQYVVGTCGVKEYINLWINMFSPLSGCGDWFMKTGSFILDVEHIYCDKEQKQISYIYIPTIQDCSDYNGIKEMFNKLASQITVTDVALENKVLRMIMNDFNPGEFLAMLKQYVQDEGINKQTSTQIKSLISVPEIDQELCNDNQEDITIDIPVDEPVDIPEKGFFGRRTKEKGIFKSKSKAKKMKNNKSNKQSIACVETLDIMPRTAREYGSLVLKPVEGEINISSFNTYEPDVEENYDDTTEFIRIPDSECRLRLIGNTLLPGMINVQIEDGEVFTIGRFDATVGRQQSSFEFERKTKAISRRHAAIKRQSDNYSIIDLSSNAGTYINGQKIPPSTPFELTSGVRVSFGTSGADYIWEA